MALSFEEFKTELISRYRKNEFDQFLHLLIKAKDWSQLLTLLKTEPLKYILYGIRKGIISEQFLLDIPQNERETNGIFNSVQSLVDCNSTIFLFGNAELTLLQTSSSRCKIVLIGNSICNFTSAQTSMVEIDLNENSSATITANDNSFVYVTQNDNSNVIFASNDNATIKLAMQGSAIGNYEISDSSFLNGILKYGSTLNLASVVENYNIKNKDGATLSLINNNPK